MMDQAWILASNSPRRKELLALFRHPFDIQPANIDEAVFPGEAAGDYVMRMARTKAQALKKDGRKEGIILAADTTVSLNQEILGKPGTADEAREMLKLLRGKGHQATTALVFTKPGGEMVEETCCSEVPMRDYADQEIENYIQTRDPFDKAGGYAIQHAGFHPVRNFQGCFANVMGLPLCHLARALIRNGYQPSVQINQACQGFLRYDCPISERALAGETIG